MSKEAARMHFLWQEIVAARSDLPLTVRHAGWVLALARNMQSGRCDLSYAGLAAGMGGVSERTAIRSVAALESAGLISIVRGGGRGYRNQFDFVLPPERVTELCQGLSAERVTNSTLKGDKSTPETLTELCHPNTIENTENTKKDSPSPADAGDDDSHSPSGRFQGNPKPDLGEAFDRFWSTYPRKVAKLAAKKAFARAAKLANPETIIAAAQRYADAQAGRDPQYTKHPTTWLNGGCWDDPPASVNGTPVTLDAQGNVVAFARPSPTSQLSAKEQHREECCAAMDGLRASIAADAAKKGNGNV